MTETMLEKAARASYDKWIEDVCDLEPEWDTLPESHRARLIDATRAALQAIREPSEAMIDAGYERDVLLCRSDALQVWNAMIGAIMSEAGE